MAVTPNELLPFERDSHWPFSDYPYSSRTHQHEIDPSTTVAPQLGSPSNYVLSGFRPGFPLQAAELNEIQDRFYLQQSLTITMMHNWITSSVSSMWDSVVETASRNLDDFTRGIGDGEAAGSGDLAVSAPGWRGTCPLYPFAISDPNYGGAGSWASRQVSVTDTGGNIQIRFNRGWYLTELFNDTPESNHMNGLKYWVLLDYPESEAGQYSVTVGKGDSTGTTEVGLVAKHEVVHPCTEEPCQRWGHPNNAGDISLNDEAADGQYNVNTGGADRYRLYFTSAGSEILGGAGSPVLKIMHSRKEVRYMNNLLILKWS